MLAIEECYPVIIPTLNRFEHFKRCVESLARNSLASRTELIIGIDYPPSEKYEAGWRKICEYVPTISGFRTVTVFSREYNLGARNNLMSLKEYALSKYDAVIQSEDDNEFSTCFLEYMNDSLKRFVKDDTIYSVCGYTNFLYYGLANNNLIANEDYSAWGTGVWKKKEKYYSKFTIKDIKIALLDINNAWKIFKTYPALLRMLLTMIKKNVLWGDTVRTAVNIIYNKKQVRPKVSMVRNWGHDGSGLHCGDGDDRYKIQDIEVSGRYIYDEKGIFMSKKLTGKTFFLGLPSNHIKRIALLMLIIIKYVQFRFSRW